MLFAASFKAQSRKLIHSDEQDEDADKNSNTVGDLSDRYLEERSVFVSRELGDGEVLLNVLRCQLTY